nr:GGDEF domain-containing protein [Rhizobium favelukesii]
MSKEKGRLVLTIDLDGFKEVNDSLGHAAGDQVLIETASRLKAAVRPSDAVCRLGGDEFVVVLEGGGEVAERVAGRIVAELAAPIDLKEGVVLVEASVGAAWTNSSTPTLEKMMRHADKCLYEAKAKGKNTAVVCEMTG